MKFSRQIARFFGYELFSIKKTHITLEAHLAHVFRLLNIDLVLDVGANVGQYARSLRMMGYRGRIVSFEPVQSNAEQLKKYSESDSRWEVYDYALGEADAELPINVTHDSSLTSFSVPNPYSQQRFEDGIGIERVEHVRVKRLDSVFEDLLEGRGAKIFMKMDTQGHDLAVIEGAGKSLARIAALQSEISLVPIYHDMPDYLQALAEYKKLGYEITGLYPVSRDRRNLRVIEFDCVMVRGSDTSNGQLGKKPKGA